MPFVTPYEKPTRHEALRYYRRVVDAYRMNIVFGEEALTIEKELVGTETVFVVNCQSDRGVRRARRARAVVFAIGYYDHPNIVGIYAAKSVSSPKEPANVFLRVHRRF